MQRQVAVFHDTLELPHRNIPTALPADERQLRANLIFEETIEVMAALGFSDLTDDGKPTPLPGQQPEHIANQIKELCDLLYVIFGTFVTMGIDADRFFTEVHRNNLTKAGGAVREDGKRMKPAGYQPVNLVPLLRQVVFEECEFCNKHAGQMAPPHFASITCKSGGRTHCTCDTCF